MARHYFSHFLKISSNLTRLSVGELATLLIAVVLYSITFYEYLKVPVIEESFAQLLNMIHFHPDNYRISQFLHTYHLVTTLTLSALSFYTYKLTRGKVFLLLGVALAGATLVFLPATKISLLGLCGAYQIIMLGLISLLYLDNPHVNNQEKNVNTLLKDKATLQAVWAVGVVTLLTLGAQFHGSYLINQGKSFEFIKQLNYANSFLATSLIFLNLYLARRVPFHVVPIKFALIFSSLFTALGQLSLSMADWSLGSESTPIYPLLLGSFSSTPFFYGVVKSINTYQNTLKEKVIHLQNKQKKIEIEKDISTSLDQIAKSLPKTNNIYDIYKVFIDQFCKDFSWDIGHVYVPDMNSAKKLLPSGIWSIPSGSRQYRVFQKITESTIFSVDKGLPGRVLGSKTPHWIPDVADDLNFTRSQLATNLGVTSALGIPIITNNNGQEKIIAIFEFFSQKYREVDKLFLEILSTFTSQMGFIATQIYLENQLDSKNALLDSFINGYPDVVIFESPDYEVLKVNNSFENLFGHSSHEVYSHSTKSLYKDPKDYIKRFQYSQKQGHRQNVVYLRKDGTEFIGSTSTSIVYGPDKKHEGYILTIQNVTDSIDTLNELSEKVLSLRSALDTSSMGHWEYDLHKKKLYWSPHMMRLFNADPQLFSSHLDFWKYSIIEEDREPFESAIQSLINHQKPLSISIRLHSSNEGFKHIECRGSVIKAEGGCKTKISGVCWDTTLGIVMQTSLAAEKKYAEDLYQSRSRFLETYSKRVAGSVQEVCKNLNTLSETVLDKDQFELVNASKIDSQILLTLVSNVLDISTHSSNLEPVTDNQVYDLVDMINSLHALFKPKFLAKGMFLKLEISSTTPRYLNGDINKLQKIVKNFITESFERTEFGGTTIMTSLTRDSHNAPILRLKIVDTGQPIDRELIKKVSSPLSPVDLDSTDLFKSTYMGITLAKSLVNQMMGTVESQTSQSTDNIWNIEVPVVLPSEEDLSDLSASRKPTLTKQLSSNANHNILIVEDNLVNQKLISLMLQKLGHSCKVVMNGQEAIAEIAHSGPSNYKLIFMDLQMPQMGGIAATAELIKLYKDLCPPVIALTANNFDKEKDSCFKSGMKGFIEKPISFEKLSIILKEFLSENSSNPKEEKPSSSKTFNTLDYNKLLNSFSGDHDILLDLVSEFLKETPNRMQKMNDYFINSDIEALCVEAHTLKSHLSMLCGHHSQPLAKQIEYCCRNNEIEPVKNLLSDLNIEVEKLVGELQTLVAQEGAA